MGKGIRFEVSQASCHVAAEDLDATAEILRQWPPTLSDVERAMRRLDGTRRQLERLRNEARRVTVVS